MKDRLLKEIGICLGLSVIPFGTLLIIYRYYKVYKEKENNNAEHGQNRGEEYVPTKRQKEWYLSDTLKRSWRFRGSVKPNISPSGEVGNSAEGSDVSN